MCCSYSLAYSIPMRQKNSNQKNVVVRRSFAGLGLFAARDFHRGECVIEYIGRRVRSNEGDELFNRYVFRVNTKWDIDGSVRWNTARYVNHSCRPNCDAVNIDNRIWIVAKKKIVAGEELTYDYGKEYFEEYIEPNGCRCVACAA